MRDVCLLRPADCDGRLAGTLGFRLTMATEVDGMHSRLGNDKLELKVYLPDLASPLLPRDRHTIPHYALPRLASPCLALPRLASPCLALPRLASPCRALSRLVAPCLGSYVVASCLPARFGRARRRICHRHPWPRHTQRIVKLLPCRSLHTKRNQMSPQRVLDEP